MEYISVSSLVSDFWNLLFFPIIRICFIIFLSKFVLGKDSFNGLKSKLFDKIIQYSQKIKYRERLGKAASIVTIFLIFSFLYLFSTLYSTVESFIPLHVSFNNSHNSDYFSSKVVLNVWRYHPYIEDLFTLENLVYYKAQENELGKAELLSTEGLRNLPEILLRSAIVFVLILLVFLILFLFVKIIKPGFFNRMFMIFRAVLALLMLMTLFIGISFLNKDHTPDYTVRAWNQYEMQLLSSGAPPESDIHIKQEQMEEINIYVSNLNDNYYDLRAGLVFGPIRVSITYVNRQFDVHTATHFH